MQRVYTLPRAESDSRIYPAIEIQIPSTTDPMKHCEQTWNGRAKIGKPTGRKILTTMVATPTPRRLSMARTPRHSMARSQLVERVMATDSFKAT